MEPVVAAFLAVRRFICDILVMVPPVDRIAQPPHIADKPGPCTARRQALVYGAHQPEFPTVAAQGRPVFPRAKASAVMPRVRLQDRQPAGLADFIGQRPEFDQVAPVKLQFQAGFMAYGIDDEMIVPVIGIEMAGYQDFIAFEIFGQLHAHLMCFLRRGLFLRLKALDVLIEVDPALLAVPPLRRHKLAEGGFGAAVPAGDEPVPLSVVIRTSAAPTALNQRLFILNDIGHDLRHRGLGLRFLLDGDNGCH